MYSYPIFDTHSHLYFSNCVGKIDSILKECEAVNVHFQVQVGCDKVSSLKALKLAQSQKKFYATLGLHPSDVKKIVSKREENNPTEKDFEEIFEFFSDVFQKNKSKIVGFGETGFDLYHENSVEIFELQKISFEGHLKLCDKFSKPFVLHSRNAKDETLNILEKSFKKRKNLRGVWHCFSEDFESAKIATQRYGLFLGIGGVLTYKNTEFIREAVRKIPLEFLVTETDAPFLVPRKAKNKKNRLNSAAFLPEVIELIADLKKMEVEECAHILFENAKRLYEV